MNFQSNFEKIVWHVFRRFKGLTVEYESEQITYTIPARKAKYTPDFILKKGKKKIYIETKGYMRPSDRTKMLRVKRSNPDLDIRMIFMQDNKIKGTKMRYSDWAMRHGFPYAIGDEDEIIKEWVRELKNST